MDQSTASSYRSVHSRGSRLQSMAEDIDSEAYLVSFEFVLPFKAIP